MRTLEMQKRMIIAQPVPKFPKGGVYKDGPAFVGERGEEIVMLKSGEHIPGSFQDNTGKSFIKLPQHSKIRKQK